MTIEEMRERKRELGYSYEQIAEIAGIPLGTVQKVLGGITRSPRRETLRALEHALGADTGRPGDGNAGGPCGRNTGSFSERNAGVFYDGKAAGRTDQMLRETASSYQTGKRQGEYTLEDYYALPDERRVELIDGVFYDMSSPTNIHQVIGGQIYRRFADYIDRNKGLCIPAYAPLDVQLDCDDRTMVQPDVLIVCDRDKFQRGVVYGAPDLVVEILSPSTRKKDSVTKLSKYCDAGVREYWIVDPAKKRIVVYDFEHEEYPVIYGFGDTVPVRIFGNDCKVDFSEIYEYVRFLYEREGDV